jgi:hypothetical protein
MVRSTSTLCPAHSATWVGGTPALRRSETPPWRRVIRTLCQWRGDLRGGQARQASLLPHGAIGRGNQHSPAFAAKQAAIRRPERDRHGNDARGRRRISPSLARPLNCDNFSTASWARPAGAPGRSGPGRFRAGSRCTCGSCGRRRGCSATPGQWPAHDLWAVALRSGRRRRSPAPLPAAGGTGRKGLAVQRRQDLGTYQEDGDAEGRVARVRSVRNRFPLAC